MASRFRTIRSLGAQVGLVCLAFSIPACSNSTPAPPPPSSDQPKPQALWGDMKPLVSVKELMKYMIDPVSDNIFDSVGTIPGSSTARDCNVRPLLKNNELSSSCV